MFRNIQRLNKKGKLEWEYIAAIVLILVIVVIILLFSGGIKEKILEAGAKFFKETIPLELGQ